MNGTTIRRVVSSESHLPVIQDREDEEAGIGGTTSPISAHATSSGYDGYGKASPPEAIPMRIVDDPLNVEDFTYSAPARQAQYDRVSS